MMRILILSINYWPEETGIGAFTTYRAEHLAAAGHDVTVCTTFPYYPDWRVSAKYRGKLLSSETRNGVKVLRSYAYIPNPVTSIKRILHEGSFVALSLLRALFSKKPDVLFVISPPLGLTLNAILLSKVWGVPYVFDVEDLQPDAAAELQMLPSWALKAMYKVEKAAYRHASLVSTLTAGMQERIVQKGTSPEKVVLFEPRADESLMDISGDDGEHFRNRYGLQGKFLVTYSGNMGIKQGLDVILDAAETFKDDPSVRFLMVGNGAARERIERRATTMGLANVQFLPLLDGPEYRGFLGASDLCLITQSRTVSDIVFPSKLVTYLAAGCPVVASANSGSEVARAVRESGAGVVVEPENPQALSSAIRELRNSDLRPYRQIGRDYARGRWSSARVLGFIDQSLRATRSAFGTPVASQPQSAQD
jgi:colanic acid biosynthesis glycosyl transferase WcaI